jgi:hypothetical protein
MLVPLAAVIVPVRKLNEGVVRLAAPTRLSPSSLIDTTPVESNPYGTERTATSESP